MSEPELLSLNAQGEGLYNAYGCVACHADDGSGLKTLEDLGGKYDLDTLSEYIRRPNSPMPIFPFSDEERRALSVYLIGRYPGM
jgi:mono/diheme cytochrome c family protein